jgi:hypothetical protein
VDAPIEDMMKEQLDWATDEGWHIDEENQEAMCDMCVRLPDDARERRMKYTRKVRAGDTFTYDDDYYDGCGRGGWYGGWGGWGPRTGGSTISYVGGGSSSYRAPASDGKVKEEFKGAAQEALQRIKAHKEAQEAADKAAEEGTPIRHAEHDKLRDISIDANRAMKKVRTLEGDEQSKEAIALNASIKKWKEEIAECIKSLEMKEAETDKAQELSDSLTMMQVEIVDKHLNVSEATEEPKEEPPKEEPPAEEDDMVGSRVKLVSPYVRGVPQHTYGTIKKVFNLNGQPDLSVALSGSRR